MPNPLLQKSGEIELLCNNEERFTSINALEDWQSESLIESNIHDYTAVANACLKNIDKIPEIWLESLTEGDWRRIKTQKSLYGVDIPKDWIKVWRVILKEPRLRDSWSAARGGRAIGSYTHIWNMWSEQCIEKYLDDMDKELLQMVDSGMLYEEIGITMLNIYGERFWKKRKTEGKNTTTPGQVVNNYLYLKLPNKIARRELYELAQNQLRNLSIQRELEQRPKIVIK